VPIGFNFPFQPSTGSLGYLEVTEDVAAAIRANLNSLLLTNWGERVMHVDFGCNLRDFIFEPRIKSLQPRIADRIKSQVSRWMPYLTMTVLNIIFSDEDPSVPENGFRIHLEVVYGNVPITATQLFTG
jgi:phage baseplate assembly protein W